MISLKTICIGLLLLLSACTYPQISKDAGKQRTTGDTAVVNVKADTLMPFPPDNPTKLTVVVPRAIKAGAYFTFLDSVVAANDTVVNYKLTEHLLVHANPWIMDTLASFDYYERMQQGMFIYDQREMVILHKGDTLWIPDDKTAAAIEDRLHHTLIDVNIPEFKLRIMEYDTVKYTFSVRVGRNESKYLKTAGRVVSLRTPIGEGKIVRIEKDPWFINPVTGERYFVTQRDDGKYTMMPQIPWLEPMINGIRYGSIIHPTSNPNTLGKAYSNGCVGTAEGEAWIIYYHAPVGTKVSFRYDLTVTDEKGAPLQLKDIYLLKEAKLQSLSLQLNTGIGKESNFSFTSYFNADHSLHGCY